MKTIKLFLIALIVGNFLLSCEKEGPIGPAGPQGDPGTANVIYSDWIKPTFTYYPTINQYTATIQAVEITKAVINKDIIAVYMGGPDFWAVKLNYYAGDLYARYEIREGKIKLQVNIVSGVKNAYYRYVIIPGGVEARKSTPPPDYNDYHAICEYYGIPE